VGHELATAQGLELPPVVKHQFITASDAAVEFLVISAPRSHDGRVTL
jgi:hypothetical protein